MLTAKQVSQRLRLSLAKVYAVIASGALPSYRFGAAVRVSEEQLERYLQNSQHKVKDAVKRPSHRKVRKVDLRHL